MVCVFNDGLLTDPQRFEFCSYANEFCIDETLPSITSGGTNFPI
jgi:hypothetical protein